MKKIGLFLDAEPSSGGMFQYNQAILDAVNALQGGKRTVIVAYTSKSWMTYLKPYELPTVFAKKGFWGRVFNKIWLSLHLPISGWRTICPYFYPVAKTLLREKCDLWIFPTRDAWSYQIPVPALTAIHDLMHRYERSFPEVSAHGEYELRDFDNENICKFSRGILVDSGVGKQHVHESYGLLEERIHVLPYIAPRYVHAQGAPATIKPRYDIPEKFIFYPAQFWEHKNHKRLIRAIALLKPAHPDIRLVLVGSQKNGYTSARQLVRDLHLEDNVLFLGYIPDDDMRDLFHRARALVMPTFFGPTNIPPLEAFVAGCPVAISGIYGIPEQVGNAALLFNPESIDEIAGCIEKLWIDDELCADLVAKGRQRASQWGQKQFNERLSSIIERIINT